MYLVFFSGRGFLRREGNSHTAVHPLADPGVDTARSSARFEIHGTVLDVGERLHDDRLLDHALLHL